MTNTVCVVCRRPDKETMYRTAQHSAVCSWEEYSSWEMKNPNKKKKKINKEVAGKSASSSAASAEGGNWAPPWQPTSLKDLNRHGDMNKIQRRIAGAAKELSRKKTEHREELGLLKRRQAKELDGYSVKLRKLKKLEKDYEKASEFFQH